MSFPIDAFVDSLAEFDGKDLFNPWRNTTDTDISPQMPQIRQNLLKQHLSCATPRLIIVNDALNYYGSRQTGVPLTSEYLVLNHRIPRLSCDHRMTNTPNMFNDPSAGFFWQLLHRHSLAERTLCWDLLPFQPYRPSTGLNRTPKPDELDVGMAWIDELLRAFAGTPVLAVGARVRDELKKLGVRDAINTPHPSRGGVPKTKAAIEEIAGMAAA